MELFSYQLTIGELVIVGLVAIMIGMSKTGIHGLGMIAVPLLALVFGGKQSSGIMLIILCIADVFAIIYYHRYAAWQHLVRLLPWAVVGVLIGTAVGEYINDEQFRVFMGVVILGSLGIMIGMEKRKTDQLPKGKWFAILIGVLGGVTTMVGNLAGSVMAVYLLVMKLPKNEYIGTAAWFFLLINWIKIPFHVFVWHTITWNSVMFDLSMIPLVGLGAFLGYFLVKKIPDRSYRWFIIAMTFVAALAMIF